MKKYIFILSIIIILLLTSCKGESLIKVGIVGKFSGFNSDLGLHSLNGAYLALEEINAKKPTYEIIRFDLSDYESMDELTNDLIQQDIDCIIGPDTSSTMEKMYSSISENNILTFATTVTLDSISNKNDTVFRLINSTTDMAKTMAEYAMEKLNLHRTLLIYDANNEAFSYKYTKVFIDYSNGKLIEAGNIPLDANNLNNLIKMIKQYDSYDSVLIIANPTYSGIAIQKIKDICPEAVILLSSWSISPLFFEFIGSNTENIYLVSQYLPTKQENYRIFSNIYTSTFNTNPTIASIYAYEMVYFMHNVNESTGFKKLNEIQDYVNHLEFYEGLFSNYSFNNFGDGQHPISIQILKNSSFVELKENE